MTKENRIKAAASLLKDMAEKTTDATAFKVKISNEGRYIELTADKERAGKDAGNTFYHMEYVGSVCDAFGLSAFINFWNGEYRVTIY